MPTTTKRQPAIPAVDSTPAITSRAANPIAILRKVRERLKDHLADQFEGFIDKSTYEEQRFLSEILNDRDGMFGPAKPRGPSEHEVPLFSAIQLNIDGNHCVPVPDSDMVPAVEEFITALERARSRISPKVAKAPETNEQINERLGRRFRAEVELFHRDAGRASLSLMLDILARWNELWGDKSLAPVPNQLAVAVEIELAKHKAKVAVEAKAA
jgi:hypothetical protein